jgi:hypothetical protein
MAKSLHFKLHVEADQRFQTVKVYITKDGKYYTQDENEAASLVVREDKAFLFELPQVLWDALRLCILPEDEELPRLTDSVYKALYEESIRNKNEQVSILTKVLANNQALLKSVIIDGRRSKKE